MDIVGIIAVAGFFGVIALIIIAGFLLSAIKILKGGGSGKPAAQNAQEARLMQDIYQGLEKLERRIDALETIMLDREKRA